MANIRTQQQDDRKILKDDNDDVNAIVNSNDTINPVATERVVIQRFASPPTPYHLTAPVSRIPWYKKISVEPPMFLYMFAQMLTNVVEQDFVLLKACRVNLNFSAEVCASIKRPDMEGYRLRVQQLTASFYQFECMSAHVFPIILALYLGAFSDRYGRKLPLIIGLFGKFWYSAMMALNATFLYEWPLQMIIVTATLPSALTASDVAIFASCFAYIADITPTKDRTLRVTILDVCYLGAMPFGIFLGSYVFTNFFNYSYSKMFASNAILQGLAIVYALTFLKWRTTNSMLSMKGMSVCTIIGKYFQYDHLCSSLKVLTRRRSGSQRCFLYLLLAAMAFYTFQREENNYLFLYASFMFKWNVSQYSIFKTMKSIAFVTAMILLVPLLNKELKWKDSSIIFLGTIAHSAARIFYFFADTENVFVMGGLIAGMGPLVGPMIRSMVSKLMPEKERGKVFALLSVCDNAVPFVGSVLYSGVYRASLDGSTNGGREIFLITIASQIAVFSLILYIHMALGNRPISGIHDPLNDCCVCVSSSSSNNGSYDFTTNVQATNEAKTKSSARVLPNSHYRNRRVDEDDIVLYSANVLEHERTQQPSSSSRPLQIPRGRTQQSVERPLQRQQSVERPLQRQQSVERPLQIPRERTLQISRERTLRSFEHPLQRPIQRPLQQPPQRPLQASTQHKQHVRQQQQQQQQQLTSIERIEMAIDNPYNNIYVASPSYAYNEEILPEPTKNTTHRGMVDVPLFKPTMSPPPQKHYASLARPRTRPRITSSEDSLNLSDVSLDTVYENPKVMIKATVHTSIDKLLNNDHEATTDQKENAGALDDINQIDDADQMENINLLSPYRPTTLSKSIDDDLARVTAN